MKSHKTQVGIDIFLKTNSIFDLIIPNKWFFQAGFNQLKSFLTLKI